ncbi:MAG TPA: hypothetical protein VFX15_15090 [Actinomycetes bacterium]|nr:hypothetical protein [Actinomycetes bacterium]
MDHNRHRAPARHRGLTAVVAGGVGLAVGALAVGAAWWLSEPSSTSGEPVMVASAPTPSGTESAESRSAEARNRIAIPSVAAAPPTDGDDAVLLLGDSLAVGIAPYVDAGLGERPLTVDAAEGRGSATSLSLLEAYASGSAPIWVVSLGTNDNVEEFEPLARSIMDLAGPDRCVVWFDVWRVDTDEAINTSLNDIAAENPNLHLIPWHDTSLLHQEWFSGADVHPSSAGYAVRGQMAVDAIQDYCG